MTRPSPCGGRTRAGRRPARSGARRSPTCCASRRRGRCASSCCSATSTNPISGSVPTAAGAGASSTVPIVPISRAVPTSTWRARRSRATLPIRRSRLEIGESMSVTVADDRRRDAGRRSRRARLLPLVTARLAARRRVGRDGRLRRRRVRPRHRSPRPLPPPLTVRSGPDQRPRFVPAPTPNEHGSFRPRPRTNRAQMNRKGSEAEGGEELLEGCGSTRGAAGRVRSTT